MTAYQSRNAYRLAHVPDQDQDQLEPQVYNQRHRQQIKHRKGSKTQTGVYIRSRVHATRPYQQSRLKTPNIISSIIVEDEGVVFTIMPAPTSTSGSVRRKRQGSLGDFEYSGTSMSRRSSNATGDQHGERGWMMRDQMWDEDEESVGKAGGVGVGVTRPKRRLSR
jgi:hypothetical protein